MASRPQVLNAFKEPVHKADLFSGFEWLTDGDGIRLKKRVFETKLASMGINLDKPSKTKLFQELDIQSQKWVSFENLEKVYHDGNWSPNLREFFIRLCSCDHLYDPNNGEKEFSVPEIHKALEGTSAKWKLRIQAMRDFVKKANKPKISGQKFQDEFKKVKEAFCIQLKDRRSQVAREAAIALGKLAIIRYNEMTRWASRLIEVLFECARMKVEVISMSADNCIKCIIKHVPDAKRKFPILTRLISAAQETNVDVRRFAFQYLTIVSDQYIEERGAFPKPIWKRLEALLTHNKFGLNDATQQVRFLAYGILARGEMLRQPEAQKIVGRLVGVPKRTYEAQREELVRSGELPKNLGGSGLGLAEGYSNAMSSSSSLAASKSASTLPRASSSAARKNPARPPRSKPNKSRSEPHVMPRAATAPQYHRPAEQPSNKLEFEVPSAFNLETMLGAGTEVKENQVQKRNAPARSLPDRRGRPSSSQQARVQPRSLLSPKKDNKGKIKQEDMQPKTLRLNNRSSGGAVRQSRLQRQRNPAPKKPARHDVERTSGRATKNPPRSSYEVYKPPSSRRKSPLEKDDGFREYAAGFPDPSSFSQSNQQTAVVQQSNSNPLSPAARRNTSRTVRIEVQLENYPDCVYQMQPTVNTTLREIKNFIAKDILEPELLKGKYKGKDILGDSLTLDEIGIRDGERLNLFVHEEKLNEADPSSVTSPAGREPITSFAPVSPDPEGTLLKPAANSTSGIQILITRGRVYDDGSSLPANIKILVLNVYEKDKYCEVMWKGQLRKILITNTKISAPPKKKAQRANDFEEFNNDDGRGGSKKRTSRRKLSQEDVDNFRGRLKQKMWQSSLQSIGSQSKQIKNVDEYKKESREEQARPFRDLLDETSPVDLVRKLEEIDDRTSRRRYDQYDLDDDPDYSASSSEG